MKGRDKLFFNLLSFLLLVVVILVGVKTRDSDKQIKRWQAEIKRRQERGVHDPQLRETVDKLEANLQARLAEEFVLETDPLDLTRVIKTKKFLKQLGMSETAESETRMRLSATVTGEKEAAAIIKYRGRSRMLVVGDKIGPDHAPYTVRKISADAVRLVRSGEVLNLPIEKAPDTIAEEEILHGPSGERLPKITVKQIESEENF